jgi:peptidoglycan/xylan/chitin deacetylase (PgdA/CDA1 family)
MTAEKRNSSPAGVILSYHRICSSDLDPWGLRVSAQNFHSQLAVLRKFATPVSLPEFVAGFHSGESPEPSVVITFDDGYVDNFTHALPLIREFEVPATIFISSGYLEQPYFWWEALEHVFLRPNSLPSTLTLELDNGLQSWSLDESSNYTDEQYLRDRAFHQWRGDPGSRIRLYHDVYQCLWRQKFLTRLSLVENIAEWAGIESQSFAEARPMTNEELRRLAKEELITIGAHSVNHLPLDEESHAVQESEILNCRHALDMLLGQTVDTFAYPHGKYNSSTIEILENHSFNCACTTEQQPITRQSDPLKLPRYHIKDWTGEQLEQNLMAWLGPGT